MNNTISKKELKALFDVDEVFMNIDDDMKQKMLEAFPDGQTMDMSFVDGQRVGNDFLMYLAKDKKNEVVHKHFASLLKYLVILAMLNKRRFIVQCDLMLLTKVKMDALGATGWNDLIMQTVRDTMFRKFVIELDRYGDLKEEMGKKLDSNTLTQKDIDEAKSAKQWLDLVIPQVEKNIPTALKTDQLQNIFYQDWIVEEFKAMCDRLLRWMRYQQLAFNVVVNKEK